MTNTKRTHGESNLRIGTAGWSYSDWNGTVYPSNRPHGFHEAAYLAQFFSVLEINSSFYRPLRPEVSRVWVQKLAGAQGFEFTAKLHRSFTHEGNLDPAAIRQFDQGLEPLIDNGLLGCLLAQFPWSFRLNAENLSHVARLARAFSRYPLVAEFRHASWNNSRALAALAELGIGFCNIDQPQLNQCMPPTEHVTSPISYVRFHGRNYQEWFNQGSPPAGRTAAQARYDYLYSAQQLAKWRPRLDKLARSSSIARKSTSSPTTTSLGRPSSTLCRSNRWSVKSVSRLLLPSSTAIPNSTASPVTNPLSALFSLKARRIPAMRSVTGCPLGPPQRLPTPAPSTRELAAETAKHSVHWAFVLWR